MDNKIYISKISKHILSKLYHSENSRLEAKQLGCHNIPASLLDIPISVKVVISGKYKNLNKITKI